MFELFAFWTEICTLVHFLRIFEKLDQSICDHYYKQIEIPIVFYFHFLLKLKEQNRLDYIKKMSEM